MVYDDTDRLPGPDFIGHVEDLVIFKVMDIHWKMDILGGLLTPQDLGL